MRGGDAKPRRLHCRQLSLREKEARGPRPCAFPAKRPTPLARER